MPSGQEITLSCTLGDSHKRERAVLCADTAWHFVSRYVIWTRDDRYVWWWNSVDIYCDLWYCSGGYHQSEQTIWTRALI